MSYEKDVPTDDDIRCAINDLISGVTQRWTYETAAIILANALGAVVSGHNLKTLREYEVQLGEYVKVSREVMHDKLVELD